MEAVRDFNKKVFLRYTEGCCWRRVLDAKQLEVFFAGNNLELVSTEDEADLIVLVTCAFVKRTEDIAIRDIIDLKEKGLDGKLIVAGCLPGINLERLREHFDGLAINTVDIEKINEVIPNPKQPFSLNQDNNTLFLQPEFQSARNTLLSMLRYIRRNVSASPSYWKRIAGNAYRIHKSGMGLNRDKVRYLRIGWGCEKPHCTFCVEWRAVGGEVRSKPKEIIIDEVRRGLAEGCRHFTIVADNPGAYGIDVGETFPKLIESILNVDSSVIISNMDGVHPYWLWQYREDTKTLFGTGRIKSMMSALQSGSDRILTLMNRGYSKEQFISLMKNFRSANKNLLLITQIIVGFPTETFEEFKESIDLVIECGFDNVTLFPYYPNPHTIAGKMDGRISDDKKFEWIEYGMKRLGKNGIFSFNLGVEIDPRFQKTQARYE